LLAAILAAPVRAVAGAGSLKIEIQLIWATNDSQSPDPRHKPVGPEVRQKLKDLPLKWSHYFEVNRKTAEVAQGNTAKVAMSEKCALSIRNLDNSRVEVSLFGKGEEVVKRTQALPKGEFLVLGGNAPNATAWLVTLKRTQ
jgi:hypothetical protein